MPKFVSAEEVYAYLLVFVRLGTTLMILPGFGASQISPRIRLLLGLAASLLITPLLQSQIPPLPASPSALCVLIVGEALVGGFIGLSARALFAALHAAGTFMALFGSFANALTQDPVVEQQSSTVSGFFSALGLVLIFASDLHHLMLRSLVESYGVFPVGLIPPAGAMAEAFTRIVSQSFSLGLQLSVPFLIASLVYNVGLGLLGRLMPQLQVFFFGLPLQLSMQLWLLIVTISGIMLYFLNRFSQFLGSGLGG